MDRHQLGALIGWRGAGRGGFAPPRWVPPPHRVGCGAGEGDAALPRPWRAAGGEGAERGRAPPRYGEWCRPRSLAGTGPGGPHHHWGGGGRRGLPGGTGPGDGGTHRVREAWGCPGVQVVAWGAQVQDNPEDALGTRRARGTPGHRGTGMPGGTGGWGYPGGAAGLGSPVRRAPACCRAGAGAPGGAAGLGSARPVGLTPVPGLPCPGLW